MRARTALAALLAAPAVVLTAAPLLAADAVPVAGSWTAVRPTAAVPDLQSGDDLQVQNGPGGVVAYAAVRAPGTTGGLRLALTLQDGGSSAAPVVWACRATGPWQPGLRQSYDERPAYDCARHAVGVVAGDQVGWDLTAVLAPAAVVDVVLVPDPTDRAPLSVAFAKPTAGSVTTAAPTSAALPSPVPPPPEESPSPAAGQPAPSEAGPAVAEPPALVAGPDVAATTAAPAAPAVAPAQDLAPLEAARAAAVPRVTLPDGPKTRVGAALLAFLALLLMLRTAVAVPAPPGTSLLRQQARE